jgi:hypothetical protein
MPKRAIVRTTWSMPASLAMWTVIKLRDCSRPQRMVWIPPDPRASKLRKHFWPLFWATQNVWSGTIVAGVIP